MLRQTIQRSQGVFRQQVRRFGGHDGPIDRAQLESESKKAYMITGAFVAAMFPVLFWRNSQTHPHRPHGPLPAYMEVKPKPFPWVLCLHPAADVTLFYKASNYPTCASLLFYY